MAPEPRRSGLLKQLTPERLSRRGSPRLLIAVAHPDDEVVGAGSLLPLLRNVWLVHVTDGAPRDLREARVHGFETREGYACARRLELGLALDLAGIPMERRIQLGRVDQEASLDLTRLTWEMFHLLDLIQPVAVLTHPYEGGHPDHDATAFAVHAARAGLAASGPAKAPEILEMAFYHAAGEGGSFGAFLRDGGTRELVRTLSPSEQAAKEALLDCFTTQRSFLRLFPVDRERYREAPAYDFLSPPHAGPLHYERFPWGMDGDRFVDLAGEALGELGLREGGTRCL